MTRDTRNLVVFAVASLLTVILIYSSITEVEVIARPKHIDNLCREATPTIKGAVKAEVCCQIINGSISVCIKCQYDANDNTVGSCINFYPERQIQGGNSALPPTSAGASFSSNNTGLITNGQTGPPSRLGNVHPSGSNNNTGTPPANIITKEHNPPSPKVLSSTGNSENPIGQNQRTSGHHNHGGISSTENSQSGSTNSNPSTGSGSSGKSIKSNNNNKK